MTTKPLPQHIAIIMDGNGRWAETRGRHRTFGHLRGARIARETIESCSELGIENLTLYTFSSENWLRPLEEVSFLMTLLSRHLKRERKNLVKNNIRFQAIGELERLPKSVLDEVIETTNATSHCNGMNLTFALSYGGRQDILSAVKSLVQDGIPVEKIDERALESRLLTQGLRDPDLIIRTSGESRLSNFFLWQSAYSELYITPTLWPEFGERELQAALDWYLSRERRFGRTTAQIAELKLEKASPARENTLAQHQ